MCKMTKTDLTLQHSFVGEHKLTPSRQQTLSALHLIARQSTRFEVSFNLEPIYYSDLKRTMPKRRTQLAYKTALNQRLRVLYKKAIPHKLIAVLSSEVILNALLLETLEMIK